MYSNAIRIHINDKAMNHICYFTSHILYGTYYYLLSTKYASYLTFLHDIFYHCNHILVMYTSSTAAINVTKVTVDISPSDDAVTPVVLDLQDDSIAEPTDFYQLTIDNVSDPNIIVGLVNITFIIVDDDDIGKMWYM